MPSKEFWFHIITLVTGGIIYSITSFAYMHSNFSSKELLDTLIRRVDRIETKVDRLLEYQSKKYSYRYEK